MFTQCLNCFSSEIEIDHDEIVSEIILNLLKILIRVCMTGRIDSTECNLCSFRICNGYGVFWKMKLRIEHLRSCLNCVIVGYCFISLGSDYTLWTVRMDYWPLG